MPIKIRPSIQSIAPYVPGRSIETVQRSAGSLSLVKLSSNESLWGAPPAAQAAAQAACRNLNYYPPKQSDALLHALSHIHQIPADHLLLGNGADELLRLLAESFVDPGQEIILPSPSFSAYEHAAALQNARTIRIGLTPEGAMDLEAFADAVTENTRLIYLCHPNNPTGGAVSQTAWDHFIRQLPDHVLVVVDQAYAEFMDDPHAANVVPDILQGKSVAMVRTFSKIYGLAGLRIGWLAAPLDVIDALNRSREPFSVNAIALAAALPAVQSTDFLHHVQKETLESRRFLFDEFTARNLTPWPSQANFLTVPVPHHVPQWADRLESEGFIVRPTDSFGLPDHVRITVAPLPIARRFITAWDHAAANIAIDKSGS
ncbi:MAG: histidinol-phosphate transaminase [Firmicutes bacterium]|nr:histidinol-phosphate transaminase [Bacillota bacterium]